MRQHRLALCEEHFLEWFLERTQKTIERYRMFGPEDRILVAVSGGKDSLSLWDALLRLGYRADGLYINLGIAHEGYSEKSRQMAERFAEGKAGATHASPLLRVVDLKAEYGSSVPELAERTRRGRKVCALCGLLKRHIMNCLACEGGYAAIATGHNLDDEAATLFGNALHWEARYLVRQAPVLPSTHPRLARKVKPFCLMYERETAAYALVRGIEYIYDECPFAVRAKSIFYKGLLNQLEGRSPGAKLHFYLDFLRAREEGKIALFEGEVEKLGECTRCGQPTTAPGLCAFCRLLT